MRTGRLTDWQGAFRLTGIGTAWDIRATEVVGVAAARRRTILIFGAEGRAGVGASQLARVAAAENVATVIDRALEGIAEIIVQ